MSTFAADTSVSVEKSRAEVACRPTHWICPLTGCRNGVTVATRTPPHCPRHGAMIPDPERTT